MFVIFILCFCFGLSPFKESKKNFLISLVLEDAYCKNWSTSGGLSAHYFLTAFISPSRIVLAPTFSRMPIPSSPSKVESYKQVATEVAVVKGIAKYLMVGFVDINEFQTLGNQ